MIDLIIRNARIIDGSGKAAFLSDIAVDQGRITGIAPDIPTPAGRTIDAAGRVVCPGFIDMHSHSDWTLTEFPRAESKVFQGVTTEVVGNCGTSPGPVSGEHFGAFVDFVSAHGGMACLPDTGAGWPWPDLAAFYTDLESRGLGLNVAALVGHGSLRCAAMGFEKGAPNADQLARMQRLLKAELDQGLFGLSAGLIYHPGAFAEIPELAALAGVVRNAGGIFTLHMRSESHDVHTAIQEALAIAEHSGVSLQISHLKCELPANWGRSTEILTLLDQARRRGVNVDFDQYPYVAFACGLIEIFPPWAKDQGPAEMIRILNHPEQRQQVVNAMTVPPFDWENPVEALGWDKVLIAGFRQAAHRGFDGRDLQSIAAELGMRPTDAIFHLFEAEQGRLTMIVFSMNETDVAAFMKHPVTMIGSDGAAFSADEQAGNRMVHPRYFGTFPRVLGRYVRERRVIPLETAVAKMSGLPARKLGFTDRGFIREGGIADLVVFDPDTVTDQATFEHPHQYPRGIHHVLVNGRFVIEEGHHTGCLPGAVLRRGG